MRGPVEHGQRLDGTLHHKDMESERLPLGALQQMGRRVVQDITFNSFFKQNTVPKLAELLASCHKFPLCAPQTEAAEIPLVLLLVFYFEQSATR